MVQKINEEKIVFGQYDGPVLEVAMPTKGMTVSIREWGGDDEDNLSRMKDNKDGTATYKFLAGIILAVNGERRAVTWEEVAGWRVRDIYYLLFKSRILTHGNLITWDHSFETQNEKDDEVVPQIEDLNKYDFDLSKGTPPKKGEKGYSAEVIQPYEVDTVLVESMTSTGKKYRFRLLTGLDEIANKDKDLDNLSINDKLRVRSFEFYHGSTWIAPERMNMFNAREMKEIRDKVELLDKEFGVVTKVKSPKGKREELSLISVPAFFFP